MKTKNIAVTGGSGRLGTALLSLGCRPLMCDITNLESIKGGLNYYFQEFGTYPKLIVNCAAYTDVDKAELEPEKAFAVNAFGIRNLRNYFAGRIVHISTSYVFDGQYQWSDKMYREDDRTHPLSIYGHSKVVGEHFMKGWDEPGDLIIRTNMLYGQSDKSDFMQEIIKFYQYDDNDGSIFVPDIIGNPTNVYHLAEGILQAIRVSKSRTGLDIINIAGTDSLSRMEIHEKVAHRLGKTTKFVERAMPVVPSGLADRPLSTSLNLDYAKTMDIPLFSFDNGLESLLSVMRAFR